MNMAATRRGAELPSAPEMVSVRPPGFSLSRLNADTVWTGGMSMLDRLVIYQHASRVWRRHLDVNERDLVAYFIDCTIGYGRSRVDATYGQLVDGDGDRLPPVGFSDKTLRRTVSALVKKGLLKAERRETHSVYEVNLDWMAEETMLATPKRMKAAAAADGGEDWGETPLVRLTTPIKVRETIEDSVEGGFAAAEGGRRIPPVSSQPEGRFRPRSAAEAVMAVRGAAPGAKRPASAAPSPAKPKAPAGKTNAVTLRAAWDEAWGEAFPETGGDAKWSKEAMAMAKGIASGLPPSVDPHEFFGWAVRNWQSVSARKFGWMKDPAPEFPSVRFLRNGFVRDAFLEAMAAEASREAMWKLPHEERLYRQFRKDGLGHDAATQKVIERRVAARMREENEKRASEGAAMMKAAQAERRQAERLRAEAARVAAPSSNNLHDVQDSACGGRTRALKDILSEAMASAHAGNPALIEAGVWGEGTGA